MFRVTDDIRIDATKPLIPPAILMEEIPINDAASELISRTRSDIEACLAGKDTRLVVIVGPCSIHDTEAARAYATRLKELSQRLGDRLLLVMRVYFEKPRTRVGWKGLINDPFLDGTFSINKGLRMARQLLLDIADLGIPCGCEYLDTIMPQFLADLVSWGAIGARTTESQVHRELASGLSCPIGFKNATNGNVQIAVDAIQAARHPHHFLSVTKQGVAAIVATKGNPACHLILRGGRDGPNDDPSSVQAASTMLASQDLPSRVMIDCSHGNSLKQHKKQIQVAERVADQLQRGSRNIFGLMLESHLVEGRQDFVAGQPAAFGQSITDACLGWDDTVQTLETLARIQSETHPSPCGQTPSMPGTKN